MSNEGFTFLLHLRQQPLQRHKMQFCTIVSWLALVASGFSCYRYVCVFLSRLWFVCLCVSCRKVCIPPEDKMAKCTCVHLCVHGQTLAAVWRLLPVPFGASCPLLHSCLVLTPCASAWLTSERLALITSRSQKVERWFAYSSFFL